MRRDMVVRSARLGAFALLLAALGLAVFVPEAWADEAGTESAAVATSTFNDAYTAWSGYATTAAESAVPGAVPVSAPASAQTAWSAEAKSCAVRQQGQSTFLYAVESGAVTKYNAATGAVLAQTELDTSAVGTCSFVDGVLIVPLADGRLSAFDEDLTCAWLSNAGVTATALSDWESCSAAASGGGCAYVAFIAYGEGRSEARVGAFSLVDGSLLWERGLDAADVTSEEASTPALVYVEGASAGAASSASSVGSLLATDGAGGVYLLDASTGEVRESQQAAGEGCAASAVVLPSGSAGVAGALALASSNGSVQLWGVDTSGSLVCGPQVSIEDDLAGCAPVVCNGSMLVAGESGSIYAVGLPSSIDESLQVAASVDTGAAQEICAMLPTAYGDDARSMTLAVYALGIDGSLYALTCNGVDIHTATVQQLAGDTSALTAGSAPADAADSDEAYILRPRLCAPVVNRDGTLYVCANGTLAAYAADADRAVSTAVGGANGLDTIAGAMAGISLPNGAGLGVGVLVFAIGFGAYAYIRNGGGRRAHDEGLDEWRSRHDGGSRRDRGGR